MADEGYEALDVGDGRRLERFGPVVVDRPAPGATERRRDPSAWSSATARFEREGPRAGWTLTAPLPEPWRFEREDLGIVLELRPASAGQVGVFPDQARVWEAASKAIRRWREGREGHLGRPPEVLSLFAYTGAATIACAAAGARVVHVDAARTAVAWARRNATLSGLSGSPIRWIAEDARAFAAREERRGRRYDAILLDPPSYGHGPAGRPWRIERDLEPLLDGLVRLVAETPAFVALLAHTTELGPDRLARSLGRSLGRLGVGEMTAQRLEVETVSGASLTSGAFALWTPA